MRQGRAMLRGLLMCLALAPAMAQAAKPDNWLFGGQETIALTLTIPMTPLTKKREDDRPEYPGAIAVDGIGGSHNVMVSQRGKTRARTNTCKFPPLRLNFKGAEVKDSFFDGQDKLKLVTHCSPSRRYQQYYLAEYLAYRMYNLVTDLSFRVRLAQITYVDSEGRLDPLTRLGFLIEDIEDVAKRNGMVEIKVEKAPASRIDPASGARAALFSYMIGNLDWAFTAGPPGEGCCHNFKLIARNDARPLVPVPYDFDYSGLVNAPYAVPPDVLPVRRVTQRLYRGFCVHNEALDGAIARFRAQEGAIRALIDNQAELDGRTSNRMQKFLDGFFQTIGDPDKRARNIDKACLKG